MIRFHQKPLRVRKHRINVINKKGKEETQVCSQTAIISETVDILQNKKG